MMTSPTWSVHQYQTPMMNIPNITPGHGRFGSLALLIRCIEFSGDSPGQKIKQEIIVALFEN